VLDPTNPSMKSQVKKMAAAGVEGMYLSPSWLINMLTLVPSCRVLSNGNCAA